MMTLSSAGLDELGRAELWAYEWNPLSSKALIIISKGLQWGQSSQNDKETTHLDAGERKADEGIEEESKTQKLRIRCRALLALNVCRGVQYSNDGGEMHLIIT